jgi:hypothetical protein
LKQDWNELEFLSWDEFKKMAPAIIQLEISRLGKLIELQKTGSNFYNVFVKSNFELNKFIECLEKSEKSEFNKKCTAHLQTVIFNLSLAKSTSDKNVARIIEYIVDRLNSIYDRSKLIY